MEFHIIEDVEELDRVHRELLALLPDKVFMVEEQWNQWFDRQSGETIANIIRLTAAITACVVRHTLIPTGLATRRTSLLHKVHNLFHGFMMDIGQWRRVWQLLTLISSICTDQGVESLIAGCPLTPAELQAEAGFIPKLEDYPVEDDPVPTTRCPMRSPESPLRSCCPILYGSQGFCMSFTTRSKRFSRTWHTLSTG